jgi:GNAT superfamily N-acetyltransferase
LSSLSYWAKDIPREVVVKSLDNSLCFGLFQGNKQIGFGRVVTDYATFAYLADVFVIEEYRKKGLGKWLIECIVKHPQLQGLRRWMLATADAQDLYHRYGFVSLGNPERFMEKHDPNIYRRSRS